MSEPSTKKCPKCGGDKLVHLPSQNVKICDDCGKKIKWLKDDGQEDYV